MGEVGDIKQFQIFSNFEKSDLSKIEKMLKVEKYPKGITLFKQQDIGNKLYLVKKGRVEVSIKKTGGSSIPISELGEQSVFGEVSMLSRRPITAEIKTLEESVFLTISRNQYEAIKELEPSLAAHLEDSIARYSAKRIEALLEDLARTHREYKAEVAKGKFLPPLPAFTASSLAGFKEASLEKIDFQFLIETDFFRRFSSDELKRLLSYSKVRDYEKGFSLTRIGLNQPCLALVYSGALEEANESGVKMGIVGPGKTHGELPFFIDKVKVAATVRENSTLILFEKESVDLLHQKYPEIAVKFHSAICIGVIKYLYLADRLLLRLEMEKATLC